MAAMSVEAMTEMVGRLVGTSSWVLVDQAMIDRFAAVTNDHQFIHVDPEAARATPFGGTIAHGLLTLSLLPAMAHDVMPALEGAQMNANYGYDRVRFVTPVRSGRRIRAHFTLRDFAEVKPRRWQRTTDVTVEIEGQPTPALVATWIVQSFL